MSTRTIETPIGPLTLQADEAAVTAIRFGADGAQYELLPLRAALASGLFPDATQTLTDAISRLRTRTESDFDSGK